MKHSLRQGAGFLQIDHRDSPGLSPADVAHVPGAFAVAGGTLLERDVLTCSHCQRAVVLEPLRMRDRGHCPKCHHYICDGCETIRAKTGLCVPMTQILDQVQGLAAHGTIIENHHDLPAPALKLQVPERVVRVGELISKGKAAYAEQDWDGAEPYFRQLDAEGLNPSATAAALATISLNQGKRKDALAYERRVVELDPTAQDALDNLVMYVDADPDTTPEIAREVRQQWWAACGEPQYAKRQPLTNDRTPDRVLRIGYVSGDFCHHSAVTVFGPLALNHSDQFQTYFYSSTETKDDLTPLFSASPNWRDVYGQSDDAVADQIRRDQIDILIDLSGYSANNRLKVFAQKPAPIQITGWGYGTGVQWPEGIMDYLVADDVVVPPDHGLTERIAVLPCALPYTPSAMYPGTPTPLPCRTNPPTFGVFQRTLKIHDGSVAVWREILERAPEARLIIKGDYCRSFVERMQAILAPVLDRVAILNVSTSKREHLAMWAHIDVALDTWPQSGGVASCETLWHGVPIVTLQGDRVMSRVTSSLLTRVGLTDFIAQTPEQYIAIAVAAIHDSDRLDAIRASLSERYATWIHESQYLSAVEAFYRSAWLDWCAQ